MVVGQQIHTLSVNSQILQAVKKPVDEQYSKRHTHTYTVEYSSAYTEVSTTVMKKKKKKPY